ncbi:MAG: hypothetical protein ACP5OJ_04605 [Methanothermobacter sp.]
MQEADYGRIMIFIMIFLWIGYPYLIMSLRPKIFNINDETNAAYSNSFLIYSFILGFSTTIATLLILAFFSGMVVTLNGMTTGLVVGLISETIMLFPDKLEKIFKINLKNSETLGKFIYRYLMAFIVILILVRYLTS